MTDDRELPDEHDMARIPKLVENVVQETKDQLEAEGAVHNFEEYEFTWNSHCMFIKIQADVSNSTRYGVEDLNRVKDALPGIDGIVMAMDKGQIMLRYQREHNLEDTDDDG